MSIRITIDIEHARADFEVPVRTYAVAAARQHLAQAVTDAKNWLDQQERNAAARLQDQATQQPKPHDAGPCEHLAPADAGQPCATCMANALQQAKAV